MRIGSTCTAGLMTVGVLAFYQGASAQTTNGKDLAMQTGGAVSGNDYVLNNNGYAGTYITLAAPGDVTFTINASGATNDATLPRMGLAVDDSLKTWNVTTGFNTYSQTFSLPAGTHFVRTDFSNDVPTATRSLTLRTLGISGATLSNSSTNANALAAADTYINNFRKGAITLNLVGAPQGASVHIQERDSAFKFGTEVPGTSTASSVNTLLLDNPAAGSSAAKYQQHLLEHFNSVTPGNAGKWDSDEATRDVVTLGGSDRILAWAQQHGLRAREHNLIWGNQQPSFVNTMLSNSNGTDAVSGKTNKAALLDEVDERIDAYVKQRAGQYAQLDVHNESYHTGEQNNSGYWGVYGTQGIADFYNKTATAVQQAGANTVLFENEYNVLQGGGDRYAQWYHDHIQKIRNAGGNVGGIGVQYYSFNALGDGSSNVQHSAQQVYKSLQNLSVENLPIELTEFGIKTGGTLDPSNSSLQEQAGDILDESLRLVFGTPKATGFTIWGFWAGDMWDQAPAAALYNTDWSATPLLARWNALQNAWTTDTTMTLGPGGALNFNGFYGDYDITINGVTYQLTLDKGQNVYTLVVPEPASVGFAALALLGLRRRRGSC